MKCIKRKTVFCSVLLSIYSLLYSCNEDKIVVENELKAVAPIEEVVSDGSKIEDGYLNFAKCLCF